MCHPPSPADQVDIEATETAEQGSACLLDNFQVGSEHAYSVLSPRKLKRRLDEIQDAFETCKKKLKVLQRKNQRLRKKVTSLTEVVRSLKTNINFDI